MKNQRLQNLLTVLENAESSNRDPQILNLNEAISKKLIGGDGETNISCMNLGCNDHGDTNEICTNNGCGGNETNQGCKDFGCM